MTKRDPLTVPCPQCRAVPGAKCRNYAGRNCAPHRKRFHDVDEVPNGKPVDPPPTTKLFEDLK